MGDSLHFEDIQIGQTWTSLGRTITESDVVAFACTSGDFNPLHVDAEFAASTIYRSRVAHGLLGISWVAGLGSHCPLVKTVAFSAIRDWEFLKPIHIGDTVHVETSVLDKVISGRRSGRVAWLHRLINQRGEVTQQGVFETLVACRNPAAVERAEQSSVCPK
ncbi:MAG TPA: MaoC/PaaZ C-terminal domain-containing protein [Pirellulaceae bacterium]|nr:MaoC/PaaZ C-terminal domain-containing protein [Pirellulaceae bacterium]